MQTGLEWKDFVVGYFTHIYMDVRWTDTIYTEFERTYVGDGGIRRTHLRG